MILIIDSISKSISKNTKKEPQTQKKNIVNSSVKEEDEFAEKDQNEHQSSKKVTSRTHLTKVTELILGSKFYQRAMNPSNPCWSFKVGTVNFVRFCKKILCSNPAVKWQLCQLCWRIGCIRSRSSGAIPDSLTPGVKISEPLDLLLGPAGISDEESAIRLEKHIRGLCDKRHRVIFQGHQENCLLQPFFYPVEPKQVTFMIPTIILGNERDECLLIKKLFYKTAIQKLLDIVEDSRKIPAMRIKAEKIEEQEN